MSRDGMKTACVICGGTVAALIVTTKMINSKPASAGWLRRISSRLLDAKAERPRYDPQVQRSRFIEQEMIRTRITPNHTHGKSAADRSTGTLFARNLATSMGLVPFFYQSSRSDQRKGQVGSRIHFWAKDLNSAHTDSRVGHDNMLVMIDTDYYVGMSGMLTKAFLPTCLYSFQPDRAAATREDYSFTFTKEQTVDYTVSGGGRYVHPIWNYNTDCILTTRKFLGIPYHAATYLVDRRQVADDHYMVSLTPMARWTGLWACLAGLLGGSDLARLEPVVGEYTRLYIQGKESLQVSTARVGTYACGTISAATDDAIRIIAENSTVKVNMSAIQSHLPSTDDDGIDQKAQAAALLGYHRSTTTHRKTIIFPVCEAVRTYEIANRTPPVDLKDPLTAFMSPILHGAFAPADTKANEEWCIKRRVTDFKRPSPMPTTPYLSALQDEFVELLVPTAHMLSPTDLDEVYARQNRPTQRQILERAEMEANPRRLAKSFIKREAYGDTKDPRPITTINGSDKRDYSTFIYPISQMLKTVHWYAFGRTPLDIANRVAELLQGANSAINTDFSRFDGRVSNLLRDLERKVLVRAFKRQYLPQLLDLHRSQHNLGGVGRHGTRYTSDTARLSGSPETAAFNSIDNAFVSYVALRSEPVEGKRLTPREAWSRLGIYGGDDGLTANVTPDAATKAANQVGLKLTCDRVLRGQFGVTFLSRIYGPDVWFGDPNSCCDIPRQLNKFHVTVAMPSNVTALDKLGEKARSFLLTDGNTPLIGTMCRKAIQLRGEVGVRADLRAMQRWGTTLPKEIQYPNEDNSGWMDTYCDSALADVRFDREKFDEWVRTANRYSILTPPLCGEIKPPTVKEALHVDGALHKPKSKGEAKKKGTRVRRRKPRSVKSE